MGSPQSVPIPLLGASKCGALSLGTPPEPSQSQLWSSQGAPRTPLGAPKDTQGPVKSTTSTIKKRWKYVYLGLKHHQKTIFYDFWSFSGGPRTHPGPHPHRPDPPHGAQKRPRAIPGTSLGEPWALQSTLVNFNLAIVLFKIGDCQILHIFTTFMQSGAFQLLHIFGCGFDIFRNHTHFPDPLWTASGPAWPHLRTLFW